MQSTSLDDGPRTVSTAPMGRTRKAPATRAVSYCAVAMIAASGWGWGAYEHFIIGPSTANMQRVGYTLELADKFGESDAHTAYVKLSNDLKPWWDSIEDLQRQIMVATDDQARVGLIARRDESLNTFIREHNLTESVDLLVGSFDQFTRCLKANACDEDILAKSIGIDIRRIFRTFKPYIQAVRDSGKPEARDFGKDLEELYFLFLS